MLTELPNRSMLNYYDDLQAYYPPETSITYYNPVILDYVLEDLIYTVRVVLPCAIMFSDSLYTFENSESDVQEEFILNEASIKCKVREMKLRQNEDGSLTLLSHKFL